MLSINSLISPRQHTLVKPTDWLEGTTFRNIPARIRLLPSGTDTGRSILISVKGKDLLTFPVTPQGSQLGHTWTDAFDPETRHGIGVVEHPFAAIALAGLDNVILHVDYPTRRAASLFYGRGRISSVPLLTGTAAPYIKAIAKAGMAPQSAPRRWLTVKDPLTIMLGNATYTLEPRTTPGWSLTSVRLPKSGKWWRTQKLGASFNLTSPDAFERLEAIVNARPTNGGWKDWLTFHTLSVGTRKKADFAVIHNPLTGRPIHRQRLYGAQEAVDHNKLDFHGDVFAFLGNLNLDITTVNSSHATTNMLRHWLVKHPVLLPAP